MSGTRHKGTCFAPLVAALRLDPERERHVPPALLKYFDQQILVSAWYPDEDYFGLVAAVASSLASREPTRDPWVSMGVRSARADLGGVPIAGEKATDRVGIYRQYAQNEGGYDGFFRRSAKLWTQYHDKGRYDVIGGIPERNIAVRRLAEVHIPLEHFHRLQSAYIEEYAKLIGLGMKLTLTANTAKGDRYCQWECRLERSPESEAYVASLPRYAP